MIIGKTIVQLRQNFARLVLLIVAQGGDSQQKLGERLQIITMKRSALQILQSFLAIDLRAGQSQQNTERDWLETEQIIFNSRAEISVKGFRVSMLRTIYSCNFPELDGLPLGLQAKRVCDNQISGLRLEAPD